MNDLPPWPEKPSKNAIMSERLAYRGRKIEALRARNARLVAKLQEFVDPNSDGYCGDPTCTECEGQSELRDLIKQCKDPT